MSETLSTTITHALRSPYASHPTFSSNTVLSVGNFYSDFAVLLNHAERVLVDSMSNGLVNTPNLLNQFIDTVEGLFDQYVATIDIPYVPQFVENQIYAQVKALIRPTLLSIYQKLIEAIAPTTA